MAAVSVSAEAARKRLPGPLLSVATPEALATFLGSLSLYGILILRCTKSRKTSSKISTSSSMTPSLGAFLTWKVKVGESKDATFTFQVKKAPKDGVIDILDRRAPLLQIDGLAGQAFEINH